MIWIPLTAFVLSMLALGYSYKTLTTLHLYSGEEKDRRRKRCLLASVVFFLFGTTAGQSMPGIGELNTHHENMYLNRVRKHCVCFEERAREKPNEFIAYLNQSNISLMHNIA